MYPGCLTPRALNSTMCGKSPFASWPFLVTRLIKIPIAMSLSFLSFFMLSSEKITFDEMKPVTTQIQGIKFDRDVLEEENSVEAKAERQDAQIDPQCG